MPPSAATATAHGPSHRTTRAGIAESSASLAEIFFAFEIDRVNERVSTLCGFNRTFETFLAPAIDAIGKDYERLAALLFFHELVAGQINCVIQCGSSAMHAAATASSVRI